VDENWTLTLVEFFNAPYRPENMKKYGLNKNLVCFALAHNAHIYLFVDDNNRFYQLDNVVGEYLYEYKGLNFEQMMRELLEFDKEDNFLKIKPIKKVNEKPTIKVPQKPQSQNRFKKLWKKLKKQ